MLQIMQRQGTKVQEGDLLISITADLDVQVLLQKK